MEIGARFNCNKTIAKEVGLKVAGLSDLLGNVHTKEVVATSTCVAIVEYAFDLDMNEAMIEKGVDASLVKSIANKVTTSLMANALSIIASEIGANFWVRM